MSEPSASLDSIVAASVDVLEGFDEAWLTLRGSTVGDAPQTVCIRLRALRHALQAVDSELLDLVERKGSGTHVTCYLLTDEPAS